MVERRMDATGAADATGDGPGGERLWGADALKRAFRDHPAGIALITAETPAGPVGLTASSVASVGIDPPALSFSVTRATGSAGGILGADSYLVHLLDARHAAIAQSFAVSGAERFTPEQGWQRLETGEPYLPASRVALRCRTLHSLGVGSSVIVVAEVLEAAFGDAAEPMVYLNREFRGLA
ncbi:flavin reductase family protein [Leucobacter allii]|uniref:Flavin reductase family protein n=1 Tax=Leucobacter allii TaxID=2932247 RepID=A0ABY4FQU5_9MICO|nr:flavin reductase family protein [Leucobacter allii]UOQ58645.1 flavin reductase family protein [Leucobacter allii]